MSDGEASVGISHRESREQSVMMTYGGQKEPVLMRRDKAKFSAHLPGTRCSKEVDVLASSTWWRATAGHPVSPVEYYFSW